jgi:AcrR family transcriptional regulator
MHGDTNSSARILDAALKLFAQKGYEGTTTREICEFAGITKPTLYYFFGSNEGVYRALVHTAFEDYRAVIEAGLAAPGCLLEKLKNVAERTFAEACARPQLVRFLFSVVYSINSPFTEQVQTSHATSVEQMLEAVSAAAIAGEIAPGDVSVRMLVLWGALGEAVSNYLIRNKPQLTPKLAHEIIDMVFDGWRPSSVKG